MASLAKMFLGGSPMRSRSPVQLVRHNQHVFHTQTGNAPKSAARLFPTDTPNTSINCSLDTTGGSGLKTPKAESRQHLTVLDESTHRKSSGLGLSRLLPSKFLQRFHKQTPSLHRSTSVSTLMRTHRTHKISPKTATTRRKAVEPANAKVAASSTMVSSPLQNQKYRTLRKVLYTNASQASTSPDLVKTSAEAEAQARLPRRKLSTVMRPDSGFATQPRKCSLQYRMQQMELKEDRERPLSTSGSGGPRKPSPIIPIIGEGSYGSVFIGHYGGRKCAIKQLHDHQPSKRGVTVNKSFINECHAFSLQNHKHVVELLTFSRLDNNVVQYVGKRTLADHIFTDSKMLLAWRVPVLVQVSDAMAYCHSKLIVHLDIKPHNVILFDRREVHCKLADFGTSLRLPSADGQVRVSASSGGTMVYSSPEVLSQLVATAKSDVYSFAITMWQLFARKAVFNGMHGQRAIYAVVKAHKRPTIVDLIEDIDDGLENVSCYRSLIALMERAWSSDPNHRPRAQSVVNNVTTITRFGRPPSIVEEEALETSIV